MILKYTVNDVDQTINLRAKICWLDSGVFFFPPFLFKAIHIFLWLQWYQQTCTATPLLLLINCVSFLQSYENYQIERAINILNRIHKLFKLEKKNEDKQ